MKEADKQAKAQLEAGDLGKDKYDALQREIVETESKLEDLKKEAGSGSAKLAEVGEKFTGAGEKAKSAGQAMMPVSAAVTGIGVAGIKVASDFEKGMSDVKAITGATGKDFEKLRNKAIELGADTSFSSKEVAGAMTEMAKAGWSTKQIISGMGGVLDATAASGENLGTVATITADAITGFGLKAKDSSRVADLMTQAANAGTIGVSDLGESYKYISPIAQSMGLSIEDTTTAISAMSLAGIKGSQAGTSLRTCLANLVKPSKTVQAAIDELGINITNSDGSFKSLNDIVGVMRKSFSGLTDSEKAHYATILSGKEGMSGLLALLNLSEKEYNALSDSMNNSNGVAKETASVMQDNLQSKLEQLGGALESLAIKMSDYVIPFLTSLAKKITSMIDAFTNASPVVQKIILIIGGLIAVLGPLLTTIGNVMIMIGTISKLMSASFLPPLMPIAGIIVGIIAAITAIILIVKNWGKITQWFGKLWETVSNGCKNIWQGIVTFFTDTIPGAFESFKNFFAGIPAWWSGIWQTVSNFFSSTWNGILNNETVQSVVSTITGLWEGAKNTLKTIWNGISTIASSAWEIIKNAVLGPVLLLIDLVTGDFTNLSNDAKKIWNNIKTNATQIWTTLSTEITGIVTGLKNSIQQIWTNIKQTVVTKATELKKGAQAVISGLPQALSNVWNSIKNTASSIWNNIKSLITGSVKNIKSDAINGFKNMVSEIKNIMSKVTYTVKNGFQGAVTFLKNLPSNALKWGEDFIKGLEQGIKNEINNIIDAVQGLADDIRSYLHFSRPDRGPLRDYENWMPDFIKGMASGIDKTLPVLNRSVLSTAQNLDLSGMKTPVVASTAGDMELSLEAFCKNLSDRFQGALSGINSEVSAPEICVYIGNEKFRDYIVKTSEKGIGTKQQSIDKMRGN